MKQAMKITFAVAAIIGFVLGAVLGCYRASEASGFMQSAEVISIPSVASDFALQQFEHADSAHARQAVLLEIKILKQLERAAYDRSSGGRLGFEYTRLAMIEEAAGQKEAGRRALDEARGRLTLVYPREELTDERMKNMLKLLDGASNRL